MTGGAIKDPAHTGTSKGIAQVIKRGPIGKFLLNYANVYVSIIGIQSHALSAGVRPHYVTANGVRTGLRTRGARGAAVTSGQVAVGVLLPVHPLQVLLLYQDVYTFLWEQKTEIILN